MQDGATNTILVPKLTSITTSDTPTNPHHHYIKYYGALQMSQA